MADKIPRPWFRASTWNSPIGEIWAEHRKAMLKPEPGQRVLGSFILPDFQRPPVWTAAQKVRFIESVWNKLPIGAYIVNEAIGSRYDRWLLDGQQRVTAIIEYVNDGFPVFGYLYSELTKGDHTQFEFTGTFTRMSTELTDEAQLREIYDRLAYGGTPHEPKGA
jgi:hypothetical protein